MSERPFFFCSADCSKAVELGEISHWQVEPEGPNGPRLDITLRNGGLIGFDKLDTHGRIDGYQLAQKLVDLIARRPS